MRANRWALFSCTLQRHLTEWHIISCCKRLCNFVISSALLHWCKDYLTDREQRVVIEGMNSTWCAIPSGVLHGSLLGPLFFIIFISDMPEVVMPRNCVSFYADDWKTSSIINCPVDYSVFQSDLTRTMTASVLSLISSMCHAMKLSLLTTRVIWLIDLTNDFLRS